MNEITLGRCQCTCECMNQATVTVKYYRATPRWAWLASLLTRSTRICVDCMPHLAEQVRQAN